jgi:hypothetical protein
MIPVDPGVSAPTGDPGAVAAAAGWHESLGDYLETTASTISYAVGSLAGTSWDGEAARSYATLGVLVGEHFSTAAGTARTAAATLRRYAKELETLQKEGVQAVDHTVHWMQKKTRDDATLIKATLAVGNAQNAVDTATRTLAASAAPGGAVAAASAQLPGAQAALQQAQADERAAQRAVQDDDHQILHWQQRARQVWQEAQNAAATATGSLEPLAVAPPPLAGAPATFTDALAGDAPFLRANPNLTEQLAQQIADGNCLNNAGSAKSIGKIPMSTLLHSSGCDSGSDAYDERQLFLALEEGRNINGVKLTQPQHNGGGSVLKDIAMVGLPIVTEIVGGGPEDPLADGAAAGEVSLLDGGAAAADAAGAGDAADGLELELKYKPGWNDEQIQEADAKVAKINDAAQRGEARVTKSPTRSSTSASKTYKSAGGQVPPGYDVDHVIDLQLGGNDSLSNMLPLNSSVNRSLGAQIMHAIKEAENGTQITGAGIK